MRIRAMIQSTATVELTAEADDASSARELIEAQVPEGHELIQVHNTMPRGGRVIATGITRPAAVDELDGEGSDYQAAMTALRANVPDGWRILSVRSVE